MMHSHNLKKFNQLLQLGVVVVVVVVIVVVVVVQVSRLSLQNTCH